MSQKRRRKPAERPKLDHMTEAQTDEMVQQATAFGVAATLMRDELDKFDKNGFTPSNNSAARSGHNVMIVNLGYAIELYLKVLCQRHTDGFPREHRLAVLFERLPDDVRSQLSEAWQANFAHFGGRIQSVGPPIVLPSHADGSGGYVTDKLKISVPVGVQAWLTEFDDLGLTSKRYAATDYDPAEWTWDVSHQAFIMSIVLAGATEKDVPVNANA